MDRKLRVFASLAEDINNGWIWVSKSVVENRSVVKIKDIETDSGKSVFCEAIPIDESFISRYNNSELTHKIKDEEASIFINGWYRKKLGIGETQQEQNFQITVADNCWGHIRASLHHPQNVVRLAVTLAIISVFLGIVSLFPMITSLFSWIASLFK
jgi:hypothetical protein